MNQQTETFRAPTRRTGRFEGLFCLLDSPGDVLKHPRMTLDEKRALLASWASDAHAVENRPTLRKLDNGKIVPVDVKVVMVGERQHYDVLWRADPDRPA